MATRLFDAGDLSIQNRQVQLLHENLAKAGEMTAPDATVTDNGGGPIIQSDYGTPGGILRDPWVQRGLAALAGIAVGYGIARVVRRR